MKIVENININLLPKDKDRAIISLLIANTVKTQISIEETLKLRLKLEYPDTLTEDILKSELAKIETKYTDMQYSLIADIISVFGASDKEIAAANIDMYENSLNKLVEIFSNRLTALSKRFKDKYDTQQPDKLDGIEKNI